MQRVPLPTIARLYFDADTTPYHDDPTSLERHLRAMRDDLVHLATHPVGLWFRPLIARRLTGEGITTLGELVACCNRRGDSGWRSVCRASACARGSWSPGCAGTLRVTVDADVDAAEPLAVPAAIQVALVPAGKPGPLKRIALPHTLSGAQGTNRAPGLCYLQAPHDLDAIRS